MKIGNTSDYYSLFSITKYMRGKVIWIDPNNSEFINVQFDNERIAIVEILGAEVNIGDVLIGNFTNLGGEKLFNETQLEEIDVYIQDFD